MCSLSYIFITFRTFKLQNLAPHLRPVKRVSNDLKSDQDSIFIYSPIPRDRDRSARENNKMGKYGMEILLYFFYLLIIIF